MIMIPLIDMSGVFTTAAYSPETSLNKLFLCSVAKHLSKLPTIFKVCTARRVREIIKYIRLTCRCRQKSLYLRRKVGLKFADSRSV